MQRRTFVSSKGGGSTPAWSELLIYVQWSKPLHNSDTFQSFISKIKANLKGSNT